MSGGRKPIVVVGSINIDFVVTAERIPAPGETLAGSTFATHFGGKGANQAVAIARLGYPVEMIGKVGSDSFGDDAVRGLAKAGVGVDAVGRSMGGTGVAAITVSEDGDNSIIVVPGANDEVSPEFVRLHENLIRHAGLVLVQLEIPMKTVVEVVALCRRYGVYVMLDPAPAKLIPEEIFSGIKWFTPNETEAAFYAGQIEPGLSDADPEVIAEAFLRSGIRGVVLKLGSRGVLLRGDGCMLRVPAMQVEAVDTTAAGDAFNGAFATALMLGASAERAAAFACKAAGISVTRLGAQASMATRSEVKEMLKKSSPKLF